MKINVGDYVRTKDGIAKYIKDFNTKLNIYKMLDKKIVWDNVEDLENIISDSEIINHSKDIIDLIEVGDYVNGSKVIDIRIDEELEIGVESDNLIYHYIQNKDIKSVLTKEQYIQNAYTIEKER